MMELYETGRVVGWRRLLRLYRAHRLGWKGIISGYYTTRTLQTLFNVGFFDEIQERGSVDVRAFASENNLDTEILQTLVDSLYALRILKKNGSGYVLDSKGRILTEVARGWFDGIYGYEGVVNSMEDLLRKEKQFGVDIERREDFVARGSGEVESWIYYPLAIDILHKLDATDVLDLGCGDATFLIHLCQRDERVSGYGIDISAPAIADARQNVGRAGLENRIQLLVEDVTELERVPKPLREVDAATTFFVLHEVLFRGGDQVVELLRSFRVLFPDVPLVVFEVIRPTPEERRSRPGMAVQYVLHHDLAHQKLVSRDEWLRLFQAAGYRSIQERHLRFARTSIFTLRA